MTLTPGKTDSPLIIDPNRMLSFPIASQRFQLISGRRSQNPQFRSCVELEQLPQGDALDGAKTLAVMILKEFLGVPRAKALNHTHSVLRHALYVKQQMVSMKLGLGALCGAA